MAACNLILFGDEFDTSQRKRVEHIFVWQLTEDATPEEKEAVVVSLNFEPEFKKIGRNMSKHIRYTTNGRVESPSNHDPLRGSGSLR